MPRMFERFNSAKIMEQAVVNYNWSIRAISNASLDMNIQNEYRILALR